jgi:hypothetical protein
MNSIFLPDNRVNCFSGVGQISAEDYLSIIEEVYRSNGGIAGQRAPLKTKTGISIRNRMVDDIKKGAILPPIVIGAVVGDDIIAKASDCKTIQDFSSLLNEIPKSSLSVIDGMQRTTALDLAIQAGEPANSISPVRIDLWLARSLHSLVYRMLVLNTGQVPWDIKRQLQTIYKQILLEIEKEMPDIDVFSIDDIERRSAAGQYRSTRIVELFLAFTSRKPHIDLKEKVAEDFARMDATEATASQETLPAFVRTMRLLAELDRALATTSMDPVLVSENTRFKEGKDIFTSAPASIAFAAASGQYLLGSPGYPLNFTEINARLDNLAESIYLISCKLQAPFQSADFVDYLTLNEKISARSGRIGEYEREFFLRAFLHMFEQARILENLTPCWSAYK